MRSLRLTNEYRIRGVVLIATVISCFIAFYNNFPLIYPDTGSYLHSGFEGVVFYDRPIFYGLFIRYVSFSTSIWLVVVFQGFIISHLIYVTLRMFLGEPKLSYYYIAIITALTLFTGYSFVVSLLIPDIFSSITLLCLINILLNRHLGIFSMIWICIVFAYSICTQFSSIPILTLVYAFILLLFVIKKLRKKPLFTDYKRLALGLGLLLSTLFIIPWTHYQYDRQFKISGSNHVFMLNHMLETGILEDYLEKHCENSSYKICQYRDSLGDDFIWSDKSPMRKTGGMEANRQEYKSIIKDIVSRPEYRKMLVQKGIEFAFKQFFSFQVEIWGPLREGSAPYGQFAWRFKDSIREYSWSKQNRDTLSTDFVNWTQGILVLLSMVVLFIVFMTRSLRNRLTPELRSTGLIVLLYSFCSSLLCSNLSTISARFQCRIIWLFPVMAFLIIVQILGNKTSPGGGK